jgi:hypothetical protein
MRMLLLVGWLRRVLVLLVPAIFLSASEPSLSAKSLKPDESASTTLSSTNTNSQPKVLVHEPRHPGAFGLWKKLNPIWWLGNADEPYPPSWYRPGGHCRKFTWHLRNPCHNFSCYVVGIQDKRFTRVGRFPGKVSKPDGGWNWAVCRYRWLRLPFIDYARGRFEFYCGWRTGGDLGMKLNLWQEKKSVKKSSPAPSGSEPGAAAQMQEQDPALNDIDSARSPL